MNSNYVTYKLGDITELVIDYRGKTPKKLGSDWATTGYRALSAKNIKTGKIVQEESIRFVNEELYKLWMKEEVKRGDILITSEAPFGQIYFWDSDEKIVLSQRLYCLRLKKNVSALYVYYYMCTIPFQKELAARATGTTVIGLRQAELLNCEIKLPPLPIQQKISNILYNLDKYIKLNEQKNKLLEELAKTIFSKLFNESTNNFEELRNYISIKHGYAFSGQGITTNDNGFSLVTPGNFKIGGGFKNYKNKFFKDDFPSTYILKPNDLIVTMTDLSKDGDTLGYGALVPLFSDTKFLHNQRIGLVIFNNDLLNKDYLYWFMRSYSYQKTVLGSSSGSTVRHTSPDRILDIKIKLPSQNLEYINKLTAIDYEIEVNNYEIENIEKLRDLLLQKLLTCN